MTALRDYGPVRLARRLGLARRLDPVAVTALPHRFEDNPDRPGSCALCGAVAGAGVHRG